MGVGSSYVFMVGGSQTEGLRTPRDTRNTMKNVRGERNTVPSFQNSLRNTIHFRIVMVFVLVLGVFNTPSINFSLFKRSF